MKRERGNGYARARVNDRRRQGERGATAAQRQINDKIFARLNTIIFFAPPHSNPPKPSVGSLTWDL